MAGADGTAPAAQGALLAVTVAWASAPRQVRELQLQLPAGSTAAQALQASGLLAEPALAPAADWVLGLWGRVIGGEVVLHDHDRLELLRPLRVDPKEARRQRYRRDGVRKVARRSPTTPVTTANTANTATTPAPAGD